MFRTYGSIPVLTSVPGSQERVIRNLLSVDGHRHPHCAFAISTLIGEHLAVIDAVRIDQESDETETVAAEAGPEV
jgi:hypothetical protein